MTPEDEELKKGLANLAETYSLIKKKISFFFHSLHSNVTAVILCIPSMLLIYADYKYLAIEIPALGGVWGDHHAVLCVACLAGIEIMVACAHNFERVYMKRHVFLQWPAHGFLFFGINWLCFQNRPGSWSVLTMTLSYALSMCCNYPLQIAPRGSLLKHIARSFVMALLIHGIPVFVIYVPFLLTRLLSESNPIVTSVVTGLVFPFITWSARKMLIRFLGTTTGPTMWCPISKKKPSPDGSPWKCTTTWSKW